MTTFSTEKDPDATTDYVIDWSDWLASGDTIASSAWIVPTGITEESTSNTTTTATITVSGGTARNRYVLTNRITTNNGLVDDRTLAVWIVEA